MPLAQVVPSSIILARTKGHNVLQKLPHEQHNDRRVQKALGAMTRWPANLPNVWLHLNARQFDDEAGAFACAFGFGRDPAAVGFNNLLGDK